MRHEKAYSANAYHECAFVSVCAVPTRWDEDAFCFV